MEKKMTKSGWLVGLLVGLVMMAGAAPVMAGTYNFVADLCGNLITDQYYYDGSNNFYINGSFVDEYDRFEESGFTSEEGTGSTYSSTGPWSGSWDSNGEDIQFFIVKGGNCGDNGYIALYEWASGDKTSGSFNLKTDNLDYAAISNLAGVSHADLYSTSSVPIPGAIWLLGSGLSALLVARRRRK